MRRFKIDKLVRDKIVELSIQEGITNIVTEIAHEEYLKSLNAKLIEEAYEVVSASNKQELIEELADLLEVLNTIAATNNIELQTIDEIRLKKKEAKGGFVNKIYLHYVEMPDDHQKVTYYLTKSDRYPEIK
jgi:predicted house-cleaning noncanonical NTP pyrophosphatase (MazG superfamily)